MSLGLMEYQCSCLENPRDGGAWWAAIYGVAQSRIRLKRLSSNIESWSCHPYVALASELPAHNTIFFPWEAKILIPASQLVVENE